MSTFLIVNNSSYECQTTASQPYLKLNNNGYLPLTTDSASYTYTETHTTTSESTYESVEENVNGFSGMTTVSYETPETKTLEIERVTISNHETNGFFKTTQSIYMTLDGVGNNSITFTRKFLTDDETGTFRTSDSLSSTKNTINRTNFILGTNYVIDSIAISQNGNMYLGRASGSHSDTYESVRSTTNYTKKTTYFESFTGYVYPALSITETFSSEKIMPNVTIAAVSSVTHTLTETITETLTETLTENKISLLTNSSRTYYLATDL